MNQELKKLILDICRQYPIEEHGVALTITGRQFCIILDKSGLTRPRLEIMANSQLVYRQYFDPSENTAAAQDAMDIRRAMEAKLYAQKREQAAKDPTSIEAIKQLRAALALEQQQKVK